MPRTRCATLIVAVTAVVVATGPASATDRNPAANSTPPTRVFRIPSRAASGSNFKSFGLPPRGAKVRNWHSRIGAVEVTISKTGSQRTIANGRGNFIEETDASKRLVSERWVGGMMGPYVNRSFRDGKVVLSAATSGYDGTTITVTRTPGQPDAVNERRGKDYVASMRAIPHWTKQMTEVLDKLEANPRRPMFQLFGR